MQPINITLDGVEVSGEAGMSILDLAREARVYIPTLCHDFHLSSYGACRICLVEDERSGRLLASCVTPIAPGMVINTRSPKVMENRRAILNLMLASHPDSCMVCDKGNQCQLRQIAAEHGVGLIPFQRIPHPAPIQELNPFIERDFSKCILCAKCIRVCHDLVVEGILDYMDRGFSSKPATLGDMPLENSECTFCGTCVALCPTGALTERIKSYQGATNKVVPTVCPFCGCGCNINLEVASNRIVRARPNDDNSPNGVTLCAGGAYGYGFIHNSERLTSPLIKKGDEFEAASWEQALGMVASRFGKIKKEHGPESLTILGSTKCTNEENYLLQKFARAVLGTNNIDNGGRLYNSASYLSLGNFFGLPGSTNSVEDIEESEAILVIGADPATSAPLVSYAIKRAVKEKGTKLLLVNPLQTKLAAFAHLWLLPKLGTDIALINGIMRIIIDEELWDHDFVARRTADFESLISSLQRYRPEYVEEATDVPPDDLRNAARTFARANSVSIVYGTGITQQLNACETITALANLAMLTGNLGKPGAGIYALQRDSNGQGALDMGCLPDFLPGYQSVEDATMRTKFGESWGVKLPTISGFTALEMIEQAKKGDIKGMYIVGENPVSSFPNPSFTQEALSSLHFLVVQDMFLTETAKLADIVLPAASFAEKGGTFTSFERRVQRVRQAVEPVGESLPDWQIIQKLANRMGYQMWYSAPVGIMDEIKELTPLYSGVDYSDLTGGGMYWPKSNVDRQGTKRLYHGGFPQGSGHFSAVEYQPQAGPAEDNYPLQLIAGGVLYHFGSGTRSSRSARLGATMSQPFVEVNEDDAADLGIEQEEPVKVISREGKTVASARLNNALPQGKVFMPISLSQSPVHELFGIRLDSRSKSPLLKSCRVRVERMKVN